MKDLPISLFRVSGHHYILSSRSCTWLCRCPILIIVLSKRDYWQFSVLEHRFFQTKTLTCSADNSRQRSPKLKTSVLISFRWCKVHQRLHNKRVYPT